MSDFRNYLLAQEQSKVAQAECSYAGIKLDLARIKERLAECKSQSDPINKLIKALDDTLYDRDKSRALVIELLDYVVKGR